MEEKVEMFGPKKGHYARQLTEEEIQKLEHEQELSEYQTTKYEREAKKNWDLFYKRNTTHFFKDRHWITREFPQLLQALSEVDSTQPVLLEVGCGVGNTLFPLLEENDSLFVHACDFSPRAIEFVKVMAKKSECIERRSSYGTHFVWVVLFRLVENICEFPDL